MEQEKIGEFISNLRKEKQMTQKQLGDALGISDKTVSKWECGKGLPDISMILPLCELLEINVNELLSGERLSQESYPKKAEENMVRLMKEGKRGKKEIAMKTSCIVWPLCVVLFLYFISTFGGKKPDGYYVFFFDMPAILEVFFILIFVLCFAGYLRDFKNAFVYLFRKADSTQKLENAIAAVSLAERALILGGAFCSVFDLINDLYYVVIDGLMNHLDALVVSMGVSLLTLLYGFFGAILLLPVKSRLKRKMASKMEEMNGKFDKS